jgi:hypothetical protein
MTALRKQNIPVKNTSACLIKAVDLILIGTAISDGKAIYDGTKLLDDWIAYTKQSGIHEFNSPQRRRWASLPTFKNLFRSGKSMSTALCLDHQCGVMKMLC